MAIKRHPVKLRIVKFNAVLVKALIGVLIISSWIAPGEGYAQSDNQNLPTITTSTLQATSSSMELLAILAPLVTSSVGLSAQSTVQTQTAKRFIEQNAVALVEDMHIGQGDVLSQLYVIMGIERGIHHALTRYVRQNRRRFKRWFGPNIQSEHLLQALYIHAQVLRTQAKVNT